MDYVRNNKVLLELALKKHFGVENKNIKPCIEDLFSITKSNLYLDVVANQPEWMTLIDVPERCKTVAVELLCEDGMDITSEIVNYLNSERERYGENSMVFLYDIKPHERPQPHYGCVSESVLLANLDAEWRWSFTHRPIKLQYYIL